MKFSGWFYGMMGGTVMMLFVFSNELGAAIAAFCLSLACVYVFVD